MAPKIYRLNNHALWGASGELALIQRVNERISLFPNASDPLHAIRDRLADMVRQAVQELLQLDFRTQFSAADPTRLLGLHPGDFLFVEYRDSPKILHIMTHGTPEWIEDGRFAVTGNGDQFAHALLAKYAGRPLTCGRAKLLAYKVVEEAIQVGAYGLGAPIDVWEVSHSGVAHASPEEVAALEDAAKALREREVELLDSPSGPSPNAQATREVSPAWRAAVASTPEPWKSP
jgi:20S proteasome alpha/beta subunit